MLRRAHGCSCFYLYFEPCWQMVLELFSQSYKVQIALLWRLRTQNAAALGLLAFSKSVLSCLGTRPCATLPTPPLARSLRASTRSATLIRRYLGLENDGEEGMGKGARKEGRVMRRRRGAHARAAILGGNYHMRSQSRLPRRGN